MKTVDRVGAARSSVPTNRSASRFAARILALKRPRYVALGPNMTVLFENHDTVLFQIQEMLRTERITAEKAILHELETYNELVPSDRELSATIFIEYPDRDERERRAPRARRSGRQVLRRGRRRALRERARPARH